VQAVKLEKKQPSSRFKGVTFRHTNAKKWAAQITVCGTNLATEHTSEPSPTLYLSSMHVFA